MTNGSIQNESKPFSWHMLYSDKTFLSLLFANIVTVVLGVIFKWNFFDVVLIYWAQNLIISFFYVLRILNVPTELIVDKEKISKEDLGSPQIEEAAKRIKIFWAVFSLIHLGLFHFIYIAVLSAFLFIQGYIIPSLVTLLIPVLVFFFNHLYSYFEYDTREIGAFQNPKKATMAIYIRILPMQILLGVGFLFLSGYRGANIIALVIFMTLKTLVDLISHHNETY